MRFRLLMRMGVIGDGCGHEDGMRMTIVIVTVTGSGDGNDRQFQNGHGDCDGDAIDDVDGGDDARDDSEWPPPCQS